MRQKWDEWSTAVELAEARADARLRMPDACVFAAAQSTGARAVLIFDAAIVGAARTEGLMVTPVEASPASGVDTGCLNEPRLVQARRVR